MFCFVVVISRILSRWVWYIYPHHEGLLHRHGPPARYVNLRVTHAPGMPVTFSPPPRVSNPDMHHGTCVTHLPWCTPGSLTGGFLWSRWRRKRFQHSRRMRNLQFYLWYEAHWRNHMITLMPVRYMEFRKILGWHLNTIKHNNMSITLENGDSRVVVWQYNLIRLSLFSKNLEIFVVNQDYFELNILVLLYWYIKYWSANKTGDAMLPLT